MAELVHMEWGIFTLCSSKLLGINSVRTGDSAEVTCPDCRRLTEIMTERRDADVGKAFLHGRGARDAGVKPEQTDALISQFFSSRFPAIWQGWWNGWHSRDSPEEHDGDDSST